MRIVTVNSFIVSLTKDFKRFLKMQSSAVLPLAKSQHCSRQPFKPSQTAPRARDYVVKCRAAGAQDPLLLRVARGEGELMVVVPADGCSKRNYPSPL